MAAPVDLDKARRVAGYIYAERSNTGTMDGFNLRSVDILDEDAVGEIVKKQYLNGLISILAPTNDIIRKWIREKLTC